MNAWHITIAALIVLAVLGALCARVINRLVDRLFESESDREVNRLREQANRELARRQRIN